MLNKQVVGMLLVLMAAFALAACLPTPAPPAPTATPDPCTGWNCTLAGTVYRDTVAEEDRLADIPVTLEQISHCSPTAGQQQIITSKDGAFAFNVFLHDTDSFVITVDQTSYDMYELKFGGFDCLYCACPPIEVILVTD